MSQIAVLVGGQVISRVHDEGTCLGEFCTIHNMSMHHMRDWTQNWRSDIALMERICPHGIGHPDPDDPRAELAGRGHGCDGCCFPPPPPSPEAVKSEIIEIERSLRD